MYECTRRKRHHFRKNSCPTRTTSVPEESSLVINLSGVALNRAEIDLLLKDLSFCSIRHHTIMEAILDNLERYFTCLRLKEFFLDEEDDQKNNNMKNSTHFYPPSTWMPPKGRDATLETYIKHVRTNVERQVDNINMKHCHFRLIKGKPWENSNSAPIS